MSEQIYFEQFVGDDTWGTPLCRAFEPDENGRFPDPSFTAIYNCLRRARIKTVEEAVIFYNNPHLYHVRMFGIGRMNKLGRMLRRFGAIE